MHQFSSLVKEVRPRLKTEEDRQALWKLFNWIDCIASDHAPHTLEEKQAGNGMPGFPGLETTLPLLITAYKQGKITINQIIEKCYTNPKRIFNLPDQPDTYIEVDLDNEWTLPEGMPFSKCKWTPFSGMKVFGSVSRVIIRGEVVYVDGQVLAKPGFGKNITMFENKKELDQNLISKGSKSGNMENVPKISFSDIDGSTKLIDSLSYNQLGSSTNVGSLFNFNKTYMEAESPNKQQTNSPTKSLLSLESAIGKNGEKRRIRQSSSSYMNG